MYENINNIIYLLICFQVVKGLCSNEKKKNLFYDAMIEDENAAILFETKPKSKIVYSCAW